MDRRWRPTFWRPPTACRPARGRVGGARPRYAAVAGLGDSLWVIGGVTSTAEGGTSETDAIQHVDLLSGRVTVAGRLPYPMGHATAMVLDGEIFVLGGRSGTVPSAAIWRLDPGSGALHGGGPPSGTGIRRRFSGR